MPAWISSYMPSELWEKISYPFPNFNDCTDEVWNGSFHHILCKWCHFISLPGSKLFGVGKMVSRIILILPFKRYQAIYLNFSSHLKLKFRLSCFEMVIFVNTTLKKWPSMKSTSFTDIHNCSTWFAQHPTEFRVCIRRLYEPENVYMYMAFWNLWSPAN